MAKKRTHETPLVFYGYPVEVIQRWCAVSAHTAYLYKIGARKPSRQALRLFGLHRDERVLGDQWKEWSVRGNRLVDPTGKETTQAQLRAYAYIIQLAHELARSDPEAYEKLQGLLEMASVDRASA